MTIHFGVAGSDTRYAELSRLFKQDGHNVDSYGYPGAGLSFKTVLSADVIILPTPLTRDGKLLNLSGTEIPLESVFSALKPSQRIFAGQIPQIWLNYAEKYNLRLTDMLKQESAAIANAAATADAALALTIQHTREILSGKRCLVLGFGRIGTLLCQRLRNMGADVTAAARRSDSRAWIQAFGYHALNTNSLHGNLSGFDIIYNTIPAAILNEELLSECKPGCVYVELASHAGINPETVKDIEYLPAPALPGRFVPKTAALILRNTIYEMITDSPEYNL